MVIDEDMESFEITTGLADKTLYCHPRRGTTACYNLGLQLATGNMIMPASDDLDWQDGWLDVALEAHRDRLRGYGCVGINTLEQHDQALLWMADRKFIRDHLGGVISIPHYRHYFADAEVCARAKRSGRWYFATGSKVIHLHPFNSPIDDPARRNARSCYDDDGAIYRVRELAGFPDDWSESCNSGF